MNNDATMKEKRDVLRNDRRIRDQEGSTFFDHTHNDIGGRFAAISSPHVVGSESIPKYPAAFLQHDPVPKENPLGYSINEMDTTGQPHELKASDASLDEPSPLSPAPQGNSGDPDAPSTTASSSSGSMSSSGGRPFSSRTYRRF